LIKDTPFSFYSKNMLIIKKDVSLKKIHE
jgi:hypothetical protein